MKTGENNTIIQRKPSYNAKCIMETRSNFVRECARIRHGDYKLISAKKLDKKRGKVQKRQKKQRSHHIDHIIIGKVS